MSLLTTLKQTQTLFEAKGVGPSYDIFHKPSHVEEALRVLYTPEQKMKTAFKINDDVGREGELPSLAYYQAKRNARRLRTPIWITKNRVGSFYFHHNINNVPHLFYNAGHPHPTNLHEKCTVWGPIHP